MLEMKIKHGKETYWNEDKNNEAILDVDQEQICVERWKRYGSAGEYQADERAGVARLSWRISGR